VHEHTETLDDNPVHWLDAEGPQILWLHGVPNGGEMWRPFLERAGGVAVDLPGFGQSGKRADYDYTIGGYDRFIERFLDHLGWDRVRLVMHDWGAVGLAFAQRQPERIDRLALIDVVPFLPGYQWHRIARIWRKSAAGELFMGTTNRHTVRLLRRWTGLPEQLDDQVFAAFDQGTQRAILKLYRSAPEEELARAGAHLAEVTAPALVVWGDADPFLPPRFGDGLAAALGDATIEHVPDAGHWPWLERPELVGRLCDWISA
jgi:pimeloyl-ACP methyl ester carboxylesterase